MSGTALRADAARNRRLIVDAAREVFGERGLDAPLDEIARRAGVGNATLYRRFPTRRELVTAVFADTLAEVVQAADRALAAADPWLAFAGHIGFLCELQAGSRALADLLTARIEPAPELEDLRTRAYDGLDRIIGRAQQAGVLREDFRPGDVVLILMANAGLLARTEPTVPGAWRRQLSFVVDGLRAPAATPAPPAPSREAVLGAMTTLAERLGCG
jgi:AcrR family transcriptional regulator